MPRSNKHQDNTDNFILHSDDMLSDPMGVDKKMFNSLEKIKKKGPPNIHSFIIKQSHLNNSMSNYNTSKT